MVNEMASPMASCAASSRTRPIPAPACVYASTAPSSHNPVAGEKSCPALALVGENAHQEEVIQGAEMANEFKQVKVPTVAQLTEDEKSKAMAELKAADPTSENDLFPTSIKKGPYKLFVIRARDAEKDRQGKPVLVKNANGDTVKKMRVTTGFIFLPGAESASLDDMVNWFAVRKWGANGPDELAAAFTDLKEKALAAELIAHRGKMKAVPSGGGKKRGKTRF